MPDLLLATKISPPKLRPILVSRKQVLRRMSEGLQEGHLLSLVSAPAGYGKTTTIRMWVEQVGYPVAWVILEKSDNDFKQFLTYILTALGRASDDLGLTALEAVENTPGVNLQHILSLLIHDLSELNQPIILVLEEYNLIENEKIDQFIELILNQAIANLHLVIATREDPNLPLTRLRVRNQLTEIRAADLSFSVEEAGEFFSNVMGINLTTSNMEILKNRTEGWAAGLQLAALSLKESEDPTQFVEAFRGTHRHILDYLIDEVLDNLPEEMREFMQRTSILDQLSVSLCEAVTGQDASRKFLHHLENNNLFLVSLDVERNWYRYHTLFAELLRNQLLQAEPERLDELHERAAEWYRKNGFIQKTVEHAFQMSGGGKVSALIEEHALPMIYRGEVSTVRGWFDRLPESLLQTSPMLYISKAWSLVLMQRRSARIGEVEEALHAAEAALSRVHADEALQNLVTGHAASIQAFIAGAAGASHETPERMIEIAERAQRLLPENEKAIRSVNAMVIGNSLAALGNLPAAEKAFRQTVEDGVIGGNYYAAIYGPINLILVAMTRGQLEDALKLCEVNITRFNQLTAGQRFPPMGALHILKGNILLEQNHLAEAEQDLMQGLSLIRWTGEFRTHIKGHSALARLRAIQGDRMGMVENSRALGEVRPEAEGYAEALRHRLSVRDWDSNRSSFEEARLWAAAMPVKFNSLPDITGVDPVSETRFRTFLCTAHTLTRLAVKSPQAYPLKDVHAYLLRQEKFAEANGLFGWLIEIWISRALMYQVEGQGEDALRMMQAALSESEPRGFFRIFLDEGDLLRPLLKSIESRQKDKGPSAIARRLLEALPGGTVKGKLDQIQADMPSERELEVLRLLADGQSYKEIGEKLFLSLNTVQFHVKSIYRKLSVNKRMQAIEKAREMGLI